MDMMGVPPSNVAHLELMVGPRLALPHRWNFGHVNQRLAVGQDAGDKVLGGRREMTFL